MQRRRTDAEAPLPLHGAWTRARLLVGAAWALRALILLALVLCRPLVHRSIRMSSKMLGALGAATFMGSTGGAALSGLVADAYGRKRALLVFSMASLLGLFGASYGRGFVHLVVGHVLVGIGAGGEVPSAAALLHELAPRPLDGARSVALLGVCAALGGAIGAALSLTVAPQTGWRELYRGVATAGAALVTVALKWLPESTRWQQTRRGLRDDPGPSADAASELPMLARVRAAHVQVELSKLPPSAEDRPATASWSPRAKPLLRSSALLAALSTSSYVFTIYVPTLLSLRAFSVFETWLPLVLARVAEALGAAAGADMAARRGFERTIRLFVAAAAASAVLLAMSVSRATSTSTADQSWKSAASLVLATGTSVVAALASGSQSCALADVSGRFPVPRRGRSVGSAVALASAADATGSVVYPHLFNSLRLSPLAITALFAATVVAVTFAVVGSPEPAGKTLPLLKTKAARRDASRGKASRVCEEDGDSPRCQRGAQGPALMWRGERGVVAPPPRLQLPDASL